jgi:hypothetical protein
MFRLILVDDEKVSPVAAEELTQPASPGISFSSAVDGPDGQVSADGAPSLVAQGAIAPTAAGNGEFGSGVTAGRCCGWLSRLPVFAGRGRWTQAPVRPGMGVVSVPSCLPA